MDISEFRNVAEIRNARVVLDSNTDELKVRRQSFFHRAVDWIREKISPNAMAGTERDVAHNRFLRAIAAHSGYDSGDVSRAEAMLSVDVIERRPLSSRRIREVIDDLDARSTPAMRDNRTTVSWMSTRGVDRRLAEVAADTVLGERDREVLSSRIGEAIHEAGGDGRRRVDFNRAAEITHGIVDGFLAEKAAQAEAEERASEDARLEGEAVQARAETHAATAQSAPPHPEGVDRTPAQATPQRPGGADRPAAVAAAQPRGSEPASRKELLKDVRKAKLPGNLKSEMTRLVKSGEIADRATLARRANRATADWVHENRVGRWYGEALKRQGARRRIRQGEELMAPTRMLDQVRRSITGAQDLLAYPAVKDQARALIDAQVRTEIDRNV